VSQSQRAIAHYRTRGFIELNVLLQTGAGRCKSGQPPPSKDPDKMHTSTLVSSLKS
jgi:hypothetical protein